MSCKRFFIGILIPILAAACGQREMLTPMIDGTGIVHGKGLTAKSSIARSVVALVSEQAGGQALCTGTVLNAQTVLTAAHCIDAGVEKIFVAFAEKMKDISKTDLRVVDRYSRHPLWERSKHENGDLAVLHFSGGLPAGYEPMKLADQNFKLFSGEAVRVAGFGVSNPARNSGAGRLREASTTVLGTGNDDQIATDGRTSSVCFGDSGGPGFIESNGQLVQWGIAHSVADKKCSELSLHTSVMKYEAWIRSETQKLSM
jgi:secreted trypsin-like serine protease